MTKENWVGQSFFGKNSDVATFWVLFIRCSQMATSDKVPPKKYTKMSDVATWLHLKNLPHFYMTRILQM